MFIIDCEVKFWDMAVWLEVAGDEWTEALNSRAHNGFFLRQGSSSQIFGNDKLFRQGGKARVDKGMNYHLGDRPWSTVA